MHWPDENAYPVYNLSHYLPFNKGREAFQNCAMTMVPQADGTVAHLLMPGHSGCAYHHLASDKGGRANVDARFYVQDLRKQHKFDQEMNCMVSSSEGPKQGKSKYPFCTGQNCQFCRMGNEPMVGRWRPLRLSMVEAEKWLAYRPAVRDLCRGCGAVNDDGVGTLYVYGYLCPICNEQVEHSGASAHCRQHGPVSEPVEWLGCSNPECAAPERSDMGDVIWDISVTTTAGRGGKAKKQWGFNPRMYPRKPVSEEDLANAEKYMPDWDRIIRPDPTDVMLAKLPPDLKAAVISVMGPITAPAGHGAVSYDQAPEAPQEETPGVVEADEESYAIPATPAVPPRPPLPRAPAPVQAPAAPRIIQVRPAQSVAFTTPAAPAPAKRGIVIVRR